MNQNLLIVDDEPEILSWLEEMFRFGMDQDLGVYTAGSALEAVKLLARIRFDVVLTDIRMPGMDGITLFKHIKENWPRCKTVFLTGYRNFEDLYQIVNHKDVKYVLKSEGDDIILGSVKEMLVRSREELEAEESRKAQESRLAEVRYLLQRNMMNRICMGDIPEGLAVQFKSLELPVNPEKPVLAILLRHEQEWKDMVPKTLEVREKALTEILEGNIPKKLIFYVHLAENDQAVLFLQPVNGERDWQLISVIAQGAIEYAQEQYRILYGDTISAVVAPEPVMLSDLVSCLRNLRKYMVGYIGGAREVIMKAEAPEDSIDNQETMDSAAWTGTLKNLMELHKQEEYFEVLGRCLKRMTVETNRHDRGLLELYYSISIFLLQFINENHLNEQIAFRLEVYKLTMVSEHKNWLEAAKYLTEVSHAVFSLLEDNEMTLSDHALKRVISYIEEHLNEELSLTTLADVGGFNASYLSRLFKQVQRETLSDFILDKRMNLAKTLLADNSVKIQDVAARTGYISPQSFTRAFRNKFGIAPTEYREFHLGRDNR